MSYSDYALIKKSTLTEIGDAIRSQKGTTELIDPSNMKDEILSISGSSSGSSSLIDGGINVYFYNTNNEILEIDSIISGNTVGAPEYECAGWKDANGYVASFPFRPSTDTSLYAFGADDYAQILYDFYGVDKVAYPYVIIQSYYSGYPQSDNVKLYFIPNISPMIYEDSSSTTKIGGFTCENGCIHYSASGGFDSTVGVVDFEDMDVVISWVTQNISTSNKTVENTKQYIYFNDNRYEFYGNYVCEYPTDYNCYKHFN